MAVNSVDVECEMFETSDGSLFWDELAAIDYEKGQEKRDRIAEVYAVAIGEAEPEEFQWGCSFMSAVAQLLEEDYPQTTVINN